MFDDLVAEWLDRRRELRETSAGAFSVLGTPVVPANLLRQIRPAELHAQRLRDLSVVHGRPLLDLRGRLGRRSHPPSTVTNSTIIDQGVLANDGAVIGGRQVVQKLASVVDGEFTDYVLDMSAMSVGIGFPIAKLLLDTAASRPSVNVHVFAVDAPATDSAIRPVYSDRATPIMGFRTACGSTPRPIRQGFGSLSLRRASLRRCD